MFPASRLGTKILPKLRSGKDLKIGVDFSVLVDDKLAEILEEDIKLILKDLDLKSDVKVNT